jgi:hypothetical protein
MDLSNLKPPKGRSTRRSASVAARARAAARPPAAGTRARSRVPASSSSAGSRAGRCRCTAGCRSAASPTLPDEYAVVNLDVEAERFEAGTVVTPELLRESGIVNAAAPIKVLAAATSARRSPCTPTSSAARPPRRSPRPAGRPRITSAREKAVVGLWLKPQEPLRRPRPAQPRAVHAGAAGGVPDRQSHPDAGREHRGAGDPRRAGAGRCSACTTCSRAATCRR